MKLDTELRGVTSLGIDTSPLIFLVEENPKYLRLVRDVFRRIDDGALEGVTSVVTLGEVLVLPLRTGDVHVADEYRDILLNGSIRTVDIDAPMAEHAADLRARHGMHMPDALQIAAAVRAGCEAFLTNDRRLTRARELRVLVLDDLEL